MAANILVIRGGAIGDFVLTLPVFHALREKFPGCRLEILGYPSIAQLALSGAVADSVSPIESPTLAGFFHEAGELDPSWSAFFARFDLIISYAFDPQNVFIRNIQRSSRARVIVGKHRPSEDETLHATESFLRPLQLIGIRDVDSIPHLVVDAAASRMNSLAAHPGSGSASKNWPEENWKWLLSRLVACARIVLVGGEAEEGRLERLRNALPSNCVELVRNQPLGEVARMLKKTGAFIGHDSGLSHLAAALGIRTFVLWGPTNETIWRPVGDSVTILRCGERFEAVEPSAVLHQVEHWWRRVRS